MSIIIDALRRSRRQNRAASGPASGFTDIPAGLLINGMPKPPAKRAETRWPFLIAVVGGGLVLWAGVHFGLPLFVPDPGPASTIAADIPSLQPSSPTPEAAATPPAETQAPPAPAPQVTPPPKPAPRRVAPVQRAAPKPVPPPLPAVRQTMAGPPAAPAAAPVNHFDLAVQYQNLGNFEQALTHYTAVLSQEEFNVEARNNLGLLYHDRGLTTEAVEQVRRAILIDPKYVRARSNLAVVLMSAGRLAEARAELRAAMAIAPRNVDLLVNMALVDKADRLPERARETLITALGYQPSHPAAHYNLGVLYEETGEMERAYDHYNDFLKYAGPEFGSRLTDVRRRVDNIGSKVLSRP